VFHDILILLFLSHPHSLLFDTLEVRTLVQKRKHVLIHSLAAFNHRLPAAYRGRHKQGYGYLSLRN
jgi:hypothetical protein